MTDPIGSLSWEGHGEGSPIVFLHPKPADRDYWLFQRVRFSASHKIVLIDLPGYGQSPAARGDFDFTDVATACWRVLDSAKVPRATIVGLSIGSRVAQHMAAQQPQRTLGLVLSGGGYFTSHDSRYRDGINATMADYRNRVRGTRRRKVIDAFSRSFAETPFATYFAGIYHEREVRLWPKMATVLRLYDLLLEPIPDEIHRSITAPVMVITGDQDPGHYAHHELARRLDAELSVIEGAGHFCNVEQPWRYDALLSEFLLRQGR